MPLSALLVSVAAPWLLSSSAAAASRSAPDIDPDSAEALAEILASDELMQEDDSANSEDGRWALRDLLADDFAQTPVLSRTLSKVGACAGEDLGFMRQESWLRALERQWLVGRLRLVPAHQAREASQRLAFDIPIADHPLVDTYIDYFTGRGRWFFARWLARADRYIPLMQPILVKHGLPKDLVYVAMVESGFSPGATSWARASGFWQFIASTGRLYHLKTDVWIDERRDFIRSTEAAADYLGALYQEFGNWQLAWAGYNAGEGRVRRALSRYGLHDFWTLAAQRGAFAKETQHYVPKIIAAAIIAKDRAKYGFADVEPLPPLAYDEITVDEATELGAVARKFGFDVDELRDLNPALIYGVTPPGQKATLRVPAGHGTEVAAWLSDLPQQERLSYAHHRVVRGDSLYRLAQQHGSSVAAIREFNHVAKYLRIGQVLIIPVPWRSGWRPSDTTLASAGSRGLRERPASSRSVAPKVVKPAQQGLVTRHKVTRGETLWSIAHHYGVSVDQVRSWNPRRSQPLRAGEVLAIYCAPDRPST
jgi:membrane-bound lytic murein transglycosylase D